MHAMHSFFLSSCLALFLVTTSSIQAAPRTTVQVSVKKSSDKERLDVGTFGGTATGIEKVTYDVNLANAAPSDLSNLTVEYLVFVERQVLGQPKSADTLVREAGSESVSSLTKASPYKFTTRPLTLNVSNVVGRVYYTNGGRVKAKDSVKGVWVRVKQGGEVVGEYMNPTTLKLRGWDGSEIAKR